jgi:hypothetical protein
VRLEELGKSKIPMTSSGIGTRDLLACSIVPQPTTLPHVIYIYNCTHSFRKSSVETKEQNLNKYCHVLSDYRRVLDSQLDLLDYSVHTLQHNTRLATAPQPVFHCNQLC